MKNKLIKSFGLTFAFSYIVEYGRCLFEEGVR